MLRIEHAEMMKGGELIFHVDNRKSEILNDATVLNLLPRKKNPSAWLKNSNSLPVIILLLFSTVNIAHGLCLAWDGDTLQVICNHTTLSHST